MTASRVSLSSALRQPELLASLPAREWSDLIRLARQHDLLGRLACRLEAAGFLDDVPFAPRAHLDSARLLAAAQHAEVRREVRRLVRLFEPMGIPVVLLKGAAYVYAQLPASAGRTFSDIDILVPKARLPEMEASLMLDGWATTHHSAYDQHYYRKWMHELPPMQHTRRGVVLDVHHSILPETARLKTDARKLLEAAKPIADVLGLYLLDPVDIALHSMTHLFCNEEFSHGLRDISDIDLLLRHFGQQETFWEYLPERAKEMGLGRPLYYGLLQASKILGCPVPAATWQRVSAFAPLRPVDVLMSRLWQRALDPAHNAEGSWKDVAVNLSLLVRAHWLRMPPLLLLGHLLFRASRIPFNR